MSPFTFFPPGPGVHRDPSQSPLSASSSGVALDLAGVGRRFADTTVLQGIDLAIAPGQFVAVVGRSGCGKSTLLRLIAGLDQPSAGAIQADGQALAGADTRLMFQSARLLPWKRVLDNVGLGLSGRWKTRAREALAEVGLADKAQAWPAQLSGGQQQRVALARALIHQPRLLLLDEPLGALDALTRLEMQALIERLWQQHGFTVLLVTHDVPEAVQLADRVIVLEADGVGLDVAVDLARPRAHRAHEVAEIEARVLDQVLGHTAAEYAPAHTHGRAAVGSATADSPLAPVPPAPVTDRSLRPVARVAWQRRRHCELA